MLNINPILNEFQVSLIRQLAMKSKEYENVINLTIGEPDFFPSKILIEETSKYMSENKLGYAPLGGLPELRETIRDYHNEKENLNLSDDQIIVTVGGTEALASTLKTILCEGDEVIIPKPYYPGYEPLVKISGATIKYVDTKENRFKINVDILKKEITEKTKAILINYPCNPTGVVMDEKTRDELIKFTKENNIYLISDEVYTELTFNDESATFLDNDMSNVIYINSFSKSYSMTGWRLGYLVTNKELRAQILKMHQYNVTSASIISQYGGIVALKKVNDFKDNIAELNKRANFVYDRLTSMNLNPIKPQGAMYVFFSLENRGIEDGTKFAFDLLENKQVAIVPGEAFGEKNYLRISLTQSIETLEKALNKIEEFLG